MIKNRMIKFYRQIFKSKPRLSVTKNNKTDHDIEQGDEEHVGTAPRSKAPLQNMSQSAQNLVWDNEDASMQDKSYSFDEQVTDANYEEEDSLNFYDSDDEREIQKDRFE